jgi:hypothetical protein
LLLVSIPLLYARGGREDPLDRVDALINGKQYDDAIEALILYMREHPDDFDRAQLRVGRIVALRGQYGALVNRLLDLITADPGNVEQILEMTRQLEAMELPENFQAQEFLVRTQELAQFAVNRKRLEEILDRGRELALAGKYGEALELYGGGLDMYRDEFFSASYDAELKAAVRDRLSAILAGIGSFQVSVDSLDRRTAVLRGNPSLEALEPSFDRIRAELGSLAGLREQIDGSGAFFEAQLAILRQGEAAMGDRNFLSFASRLIRGQGDAGQSGMLHALESCWAQKMEDLGRILTVSADAAYDRALGQALAGQYREAEAGFREAAGRSALVREHLELDRTFWQGAALELIPPTPLLDSFPVLAGRVPRVLSLICRDIAIFRSALAAALELRLDELAAGPDPLAGDAAETRAAFGELLGEAEARIGELRGAGEEFRRLLSLAGEGAADEGAVPPEGEDPFRYTGEALDLLERFRSRCLDSEFSWAFRRYTALNGDLAGRLELRRAGFDAASRLMTGLRAGEEVFGQAGLGPDFSPAPAAAGRYPREALGLLERLEGELALDRDAAAEVLARYGEERRELSGPGKLGPLLASAQGMAAELEDLARRAAGQSRLAGEQAARAEELRAQGDRFYREADAAADRGDFAAARTSIQRAAERYDGSLAIQESASLRQEWDTRMLDLGQEISQGENEVVVREVRDTLNRARNEYFAGNFSAAERLVVQGRNRWEAVNVEDNPEISYWLSMIRGALSLSTSRIVPATAPLYTEMGQLLSDARRSYEEGAAHIRARRRDEGLALFSNARQKTREVKLIFPANQEAGLLELMMDQVSDPAAFNASFQRRLDEAAAGVRQRSAEAFADLQNLAELNPRYPGIAAALRQAEIDMGYRAAPPDPQRTRRSDELTQAARTIVNADVREQFDAALRQLNEALTLNPNNTQAMTLKDRVQTRMGVGNAVLSSAEEGEYQRAVRELQQGNSLVAMSIVEQLLQNPRNRNSTRIMELRRRIELVL